MIIAILKCSPLNKKKHDGKYIDGHKGRQYKTSITTTLIPLAKLKLQKQKRKRKRKKSRRADC
jgi:hypothetical protein